MTKMSGADLANACAEYVNSFSCNDDEFAIAMARQHRTLQQSFTRLAIAFLREQAKEDDYDLRNRAAIQLSRKIIALIDDEKLSLPLV